MPTLRSLLSAMPLLFGVEDVPVQEPKFFHALELRGAGFAAPRQGSCDSHGPG